MKYLLPLVFLFIISCGNEPVQSESNEINNGVAEPVTLFGNTQGTTFSILCNDPVELSMAEVTNILSNFDLALSGYIPESTVSKLNNMGAGEFSYNDRDGYFNRCYDMALEVYQITEGAFDPAVYPLVDGWGFFKDVELVLDSTEVDSLKALTGFTNGYHFTYQPNRVEIIDSIVNSKIIKNTAQAKLDFNAIAQGLAVDVLAEELEKRGAKNYFVEIGGEIRVKGLNADGELWRIGIDKPIEGSDAENREIQEIVHVDNRSIATSGSYRKFYEKNGVKYSHTLDPKTGYPVKHSLLSATVVAKSCAMADALATSFMVMGPEKAISFIESHPDLNIDAYLIFINQHDEYEMYYTLGFGQMIVL